MSTHCTIGTKKDKQYRVIYCYQDGYPEHVGRILYNCYNTDERVEALLDLGHISSLDEFLEPICEFSTVVGDHSGELKKHSFLTPHVGVTVAYGRDRGEENIQADIYNEPYTYKKNREAYNYLWIDGEWFLGNKKLSDILD